jgi:hypothetical protein
MKRYIDSVPETLLNNNGEKQYAVTTLLMINDDYLPGCITLAYSIECANKKLRKEIDLICMVTHDISYEAKQDLLQYYDKVIDIEYIEIGIENIKHSKEKIKYIYSKAFTKINCLKLTNYKKILQIDVDMIVIKETFFNLFNINTPASPFVGCLVFYKKDIIKYYKKIYEKYLSNGLLIPKKLYDINCSKLYKKNNIDKMSYLGIESTIILLEPNIDDYNNIINMMKENKIIFTPLHI